jgi:hypothetical protein
MKFLILLLILTSCVTLTKDERDELRREHMGMGRDFR